MTAKIISLNASLALLARIEAKAADIVPLIVFGRMVVFIAANERLEQRDCGQ